MSDGAFMERFPPMGPSHVGTRIDFSGARSISQTIATTQREGVAMLWSILGRHGHAFLADEVGMGKTYQALGVIALTWMRDPSARVLVVTPNAAIQNNWRREYESFTEVNVRQCGGRVRDPLTGSPARPIARHANTDELMRSMLRGDPVLHTVRLSGFSSVAGSLGLSLPEDPDAPGDTLPMTYGDVREHLGKRGYHVAVPDGRADVELTESHHLNVAAAMMLGPILPGFDLVVIDESHLLRNRGGNIMTSTLGYILGMRPAVTAAPVAPPARGAGAKRVPATLFLSATPAHRAERDIFAQLAFVTERASRQDLTPAERREIIASRFVRRLRRFAGHSKYDYREDALHGALAVRPPATDGEAEGARASAPREQPSVLDELFFIAAQRAVEGALAASRRDNMTATVKLGFLECFESYESSAVARGDAEGGVDGTHEDEKGAAPDHDALRELSRAYHEVTDGGLPPHPKMRQIERTYREDVLSGARPEKLLIFVRRLASVDEIMRRVLALYDERALRWLRATISSFDADVSLPDAASFKAYADGVLGRDDALAVDRGDEDAEAAQKRSGVLEVFATKSEGDVTPSNRFRSRFLSSGTYREVFEENLLRLYHRASRARDGGEPDETYEAFCARVMSAPSTRSEGATLRDEVVDALDDPELWRSGGRELKVSRACALIHDRVLGSLGGALSRELLRVVRASNQLIEPRSPSAGAPMTGARRARIEEALDASLMNESVWDVLADWRGDEGHGDLDEISRALEVGVHDSKTIRSTLERRMFVRNVWEKNLRVGEGVLELFCAFASARAGSKGNERLDRAEVARALAASIVEGATGAPQRRRHTAWRMAEFSRLFRHMRKLVGGRTERGRAWWSETKWSIFDSQEPILGVVGGSSGRERAITQFNSPFFPDLIACTDVLREGVNLHLCCRRVWHFGLSTTPGDVEQRTGRVDRYHCVVHRALSDQSRASERAGDRTLEVGYPYLKSSIDERQLTQALLQRLRIQPLLDQGILDGARVEGVGALRLDGASSSLERVVRALDEMKSSGSEPFVQDLDGLDESLDDPFSDLVAVEDLTHEGVFGALHRILSEVALETRGQHERVVGQAAVFARFNVRVSYEGGGVRDQPIIASLGRSAGPWEYMLELRTPLGQHASSAELVALIQRDYADTMLRAVLVEERGGGVECALARDVPLTMRELGDLTSDHGAGVVRARLHAAARELARHADAIEVALWPGQDISWGDACP